jgi:signal peptidase II
VIFSSLKTVLIFPVVTLAVVLADQISKLWIRTNMLPGQSIPEGGLILITYVRNTGAAFGLLANQNLLIIFTVLVGIAAIALYYAHPLVQTLWLRLSLSLLLGGAIGNLIDRLRFGYVIDFIDLRVWPVFNIADSCITVGVGMMAYYLLFKATRQKSQ